MIPERAKIVELYFATNSVVLAQSRFWAESSLAETVHVQELSNASWINSEPLVVSMMTIKAVVVDQFHLELKLTSKQ